MLDPEALDIDEAEALPLSEEEWAEFRAASRQAVPEFLEGQTLPDVLMTFQKNLLISTSTYSVTVADKARRTGATWAIAGDAVLTAGAAVSAGGMDVLYIGYNLDMAREFIDTAAMWAKAFMPACSQVGEFLFRDAGVDGEGDKFIQAFRITFASGFEICALSSRPRSLRGRQGYVILDEFAFHDDPDGLLKACMALLIWGGKILVISTHNGADNPFNLLIQDIRKGELGADANVVRCTFDDAVKDGLYERVCLRKGIEWTAEGEARWRASIRKIYRANAEEELDCVPAQGSGVYLSRMILEACTVPPDKVFTLRCPAGFELREEVRRIDYVQSWLDQEIAPELAALNSKLQHAFGQDFARTGDASMYVPLAIEPDLTRRAPFVIEMRNVPFEQQKQVVIWVTEQLPRFMGGKLDATGNGAYLAEVAKQKFGESLIEEVKLSQAWYAEWMPKMKVGLEDRKLLYPANDNLVSDLRMVRLIRGIPMVPQGIKNEGTDGTPRHGDFAPALALANAASFNSPQEFGYHSANRGVGVDASATRGPRGRMRPNHDDDFKTGGDGGRFGTGGTW
jgi:phage FluMu gp28-like protein